MYVQQANLSLYPPPLSLPLLPTPELLMTVRSTNLTMGMLEVVEQELGAWFSRQ